MLAKLCREVPVGYSKSIDKVRAHLISEAGREVLQFYDETIESKTRYLENTEAPVDDPLKGPAGEQKQLPPESSLPAIGGA
jgi:hypothetical protein